MRSESEGMVTQASRRHDQLEDEFWKPLIDGGARMHILPDDEDETTPLDPYAWTNDMLEHFTSRSKQYILQVQLEMQGPGTKITDTTAGCRAALIWHETQDTNTYAQYQFHSQSQLTHLTTTKEDLLTTWSTLLTNDLSRFSQELNSLNHKLEMISYQPQSSSQLQPPSNASQVRRENYRRIIEQLEKQRAARLASRGFRVAVISMILGGISAVATVSAACNVM